MRVIRAAQLNSAQFPHRHLSTFKSITTKSFHTPQVNVVPLLPTSVRHVPNGSAPKGATRARFSSSLSYFDGTLPLSPAQKETIYALSTPPGRAGIAVIRISGPAVLDVYRNLVKKKTRRDASQFTGDLHVEPWKMQRCSIVDPTTKQVLDEGLAVYFAAPRSFTSEDVLELHVHSGPAIISAILTALSKQPGCRMAERGEFVRRAFEAGRMDLTQVEGLRDLIDAETEEQRKWALSAAQGKVREEIEALRGEIIACLMLCEAEIDFGDTEEIDGNVIQQAKDRASALLDRLRVHLQDSRKGEIMRSGIRVVIFGEPNAGKSSLLNWLARREAAIVTPLPGTTRDVLEVSLDLGGLPIIVCDTAGLRRTADPVESIGVKRAEDAVREADLALCVVSIPELEKRHRRQQLQRPTPNPSELSSPVATWPAEMASLVTSKSHTVVLLNKIDLATESEQLHAKCLAEAFRPDVTAGRGGEGVINDLPLWRASVTTGEGMQTFVEGLVRTIKNRYDMVQGEEGTMNARSDPLIRHARQRVHMENAVAYLEAFMQCMGEDGNEEANNVVLGAEELRYAAREIGQISRAVTVDDVLDAVFRDFCIGK